MLGDLLRKTREQKNLSIDDIEKGTNIRKLYIKSIEDGDYDKLPGEVFLKGFIKTYGRFLGLDGPKLIEQYKAEKNSSISNPPISSEAKTETTKTPTEPVASTDNTTTTPDNTQQKSNEKPNKPVTKNEKPSKPVTKNEKPNKPVTKSVPNIDDFNDSKQYLETKNSGKTKKNIIIIASIIIVIVAGAIAFLSSQGSNDEPATTNNQPKTEQAQPQQQNTPAPASVSGSEVSAVFSQDCWTEVKVDGNTVLSEIVKAGSTLNWKGNNQIEITVGNAGAVDVTFNGQVQGKMGDLGAVVTKSFVAPNATPATQQQPVQQQNQ